MLKKILIGVAIVIIVGIIVFCYFFFQKQTAPVSSALNAVPINASFVFESKNFEGFIKKIKENNPIWNELVNIPTIKKINETLSFIDSLIKKNPKAKEIFTGRSVIVSAHFTGKDKFDFLYLIGLSNRSVEEAAETLTGDLLQGKAAITERPYDNATIYDVKFTSQENPGNFSYTVSNGVFILSFSSILVEDATRQLATQNSLVTEGSFKKVLNTAGKNVEANLYINYKTFPKLVSLFLNSSYANYIATFDNFANWSELDVNVKTDAVLLNGFTYTDDSVNNYLNLFLKQPAQKIDIESVLPSSTSAFIAFGIGDFNAYFTDYKRYLDKVDKLEAYTNEITRINKEYGIDIEKIFNSFLESEIALVYTDVNSSDINNDAFVVMNTKSKSQAEDQLMTILKSYSKNKNKEFSSLIHPFEIDEETSHPIFRMPIEKLGLTLFGNIFAHAETNYFTFINNYLVFGKSIASISKFIQDNEVLQKTLGSDLEFNKFSEYLESKSNIYIYSNISRCPEMLKYYLSPEYGRNIDSNLATIQKFRAFSIQLSSGKDMIYNNIFFKYSPVVISEPRTAWETHLDTLVDFKPKLVINHNTDDKEIFVQDKKNTIYLINSSGRILWKKPLEEKIMSDVYQVDVFRNKKLQYLFNTKNFIHIIDRNGNYIDRFPAKLVSPATNGIAVFDYENNKEYRIFVACADRRIYVYSKEGNTIEGWNFEKAESNIYGDIQHFRVEDKDFIVFSDSLKTYFLDRKGSDRLKPEKQFPKSRGSMFVMDTPEKLKDARIVTTDTTGTVEFIYFDGKVKTKKFGDYSSKHFFDYQDVNGDEIKDYIFVDENKLEVYNGKSNTMMYSYEFKDKILLKPVYYFFTQNDRKIGITSSTTNEIFLFNSTGKIYNGFPLRGKTLFSIGLLNKSNAKFNLVVGSDDNFLYNYEVN